MIALARLLPAWAWLALGAALVIGAQQLRLSHVRAELAATHAEYAAQTAHAEKQARAREALLRTRIDTIQSEARHARETADTAAAAAADSAGRLHAQVTRLLASRGATCDTIAAQRGQAAADLLASVLTDMERAGRAMAADADAAGIAGQACQAAYQSLSR